MASGYFTGTTGNKYITARITWSSTPDTVNNRSTVTATLAYAKSSSSTGSTYGTGEFSITINGSAKSFSSAITLNPNDTWVTVGSHSVVVPHNSDGSKSIGISATGGIPGLTFNSTNCSATVILDKIPRATIPTFGATTQTIGSSMTILLNAADSSFHHTVTYAWGPSTGTIATKAQSSVSWTLPMSLCNGVPNGTHGTLFVTVETFTSNGVSLGTSTRSTQCNVPASVVPTIGAIALSDTGGHVPSAWGVYVQNKSKLHVDVSASGAYSSRIVAYSIKALGRTIGSNDSDIKVIDTSGNISVEVTVTDSRGRTATATQSITVLPYIDPMIENVTVERANSAGALTDNGTYAKITLKASGSAVNNKNTVTANIYHMRSDAATWTLARTIAVAYSIDEIVMIANMISSRSYAIKIELTDTFGSTIAEATLKAEGAVMGWMPGGIGVSFGKTAEENYMLDSAWKIHGRQGAQFDGPVDATAFTLNGAAMMRTVDIVAVHMNGANQQLGATNTYIRVPFTNTIFSMQGKLSISNNGIKIPAGVRAVRISAQVCLGVAAAGLRYVIVGRNTADTTIARSQKNHASTSTIETQVISGAITPVSEGDVIFVGVYGNTSDTIYGIMNQTYLTVEAFA